MGYTQICIIAMALLIVSYDVFAVLKWGGEKSVSWQMWLWAKAYPIVPFLLGVIIGHWFWVQDCYCAGLQ